MLMGRCGAPKASRSFFQNRSCDRFDQKTGRAAPFHAAEEEMPYGHGMTVWDHRIWFSVAETGEIYRFGGIPA